MKMLHRTLGLAVLAVSLLSSLPARAQEEEKVLNVDNWSDYIAEDTIKTPGHRGHPGQA
jgi:putrescine transport system substrate-binding protein